MGLLDLLDREVYGAITEKQKDGIGQIRASIKGLLQLIEDHLQMAQDEAGRLEVHLEAADAPVLLEAAAQSVEWLVQTKHIQLQVEAEQDLPEMHTDPGKVKQIIVNLVTNAVKYTPDGGSVTVRMRRRDDRFLSISGRRDTYRGAGMRSKLARLRKGIFLPPGAGTRIRVNRCRSGR